MSSKLAKSGAVCSARVLTAPQICFPFPGNSELNVVVEILDPEVVKAHDLGSPIIAVILGQRVPQIGDMVKVVKSDDHYMGFGDTDVTRYYIKD